MDKASNIKDGGAYHGRYDVAAASGDDAFRDPPSVPSAGGARRDKKPARGPFKRLKSIKNIELIVAGILCAAILLIYFSSFDQKTSGKVSVGSQNFAEYVGGIETNLSQILAQIKGAGRVDVMITFESGVEQVYAYSVDTQTNKTNDGAKETSIVVDKNTIVVTNGQPVIIKEIMPLIKGVLVVAEGADNAAVRLQLLKAVQALLDVRPANVEIFPMKKK
jgi:stage III sporulation protein AG